MNDYYLNEHYYKLINKSQSQLQREQMDLPAMDRETESKVMFAAFIMVWTLMILNIIYYSFIKNIKT